MKFDYEIHIKPYMSIECIEDHNGYIVWRVGTGRNVEILHLRAYVMRRGTGTSLLGQMLHKLKSKPPYATVFVFCRGNNSTAREFYRSSGFTSTLVRGVYDDGDAILFSARYEDLYKFHLGNS